jgi:hypothetical protein
LYDLSGLTTIDIDPGKNWLHSIGLDAKVAIVLKIVSDRCYKRHGTVLKAAEYVAASTK